ncbi:MAG: hypothetical protein IPJ90_15320 [Anaerolineaceae bacterium]|nr:hypothetical protein [Anaerolineaceae bacterium]
MNNAPLLAILLIAFIGQFALGLLQATFALFGDAVLFADYSDRIVDLGIGILLGTVGLFPIFDPNAALSAGAAPLWRGEFGDCWQCAAGNWHVFSGDCRGALVWDSWLHLFSRLAWG